MPKQTMKKPPRLKRKVESWLASNGVDAVATYAERGRKHRDFSDTDLLEFWVSSFKKMSENYGDSDARLANGEYESEITIRGLETPISRVAEESARYVAAALAAFKRIKAEEPERFDEIALGIALDVASHESDLKKPKQ